MTGHVAGCDDEIVYDGGPRDASHEGHDVFRSGAALVNDVYDCLVIAEY